MKDQLTSRREAPSTSSLWCDVLGIGGERREIAQALLESMLTLLITKDQTERANAVRKINDINAALMAKIQAMEDSHKQPLTPARLIELLRTSNLSQAELAEALDVSQSNVSEWIKGTRPIPQKHVEKVYKACIDAAMRIFEVEASILGGSPENQSAA